MVDVVFFRMDIIFIGEVIRSGMLVEKILLILGGSCGVNRLWKIVGLFGIYRIWYLFS